ncbi:hypothetical protein FQN51_000392 [Onygenales sp. PD_10]|nr:hypothetical protein FQN51_000392 [Onygenales sp. PD_10]
MYPDQEGSTIAESAGKCLESFNECLANFSLLPPRQQSGIEDQLGRFSIWTSNIGVFASTRASLDHRLRDVEDVHRLVQGLLWILNEHIQRCLSRLVSLDPSGDGYNQESKISAINSIDGVVTDISREISLLHQLSNTIRKAGSERHNLKAATSFVIRDEYGDDVGPIFMNFAMGIIQRKFPVCDKAIQTRLAAAMLLRRKRILYRRSRYGQSPSRNTPSAPQMMAPKRGITEADVQPTQLSRSLGQPKIVSDAKPTPSVAESRTMTATTLHMDEWKKASTPSVISESKSISPSHHEELAFPPPPAGSPLRKFRTLKEQRRAKHQERLNSLPHFSLYQQYNGNPPLHPNIIDLLKSDILNLESDLEQEIERDRKNCFNSNVEVTCPYCCCVLSSADVKSDRKWIEHVKHDVYPYVCLFETCDTPDTLYNHSEDWLKHMGQHQLQWLCAVKSHEVLIFNNQSEYEEHMSTRHKVSKSQAALLAERSSRPPRQIFVSCPLCGYSNSNSCLDNHIATHLSYLALKSLPFTDDETNDSGSKEMVVDSDKIYQQHRSTIAGDPGYDIPLDLEDKLLISDNPPAPNPPMSPHPLRRKLMNPFETFSDSHGNRESDPILEELRHMINRSGPDNRSTTSNEQKSVDTKWPHGEEIKKRRKEYEANEMEKRKGKLPSQDYPFGPLGYGSRSSSLGFLFKLDFVKPDYTIQPELRDAARNWSPPTYPGAISLVGTTDWMEWHQGVFCLAGRAVGSDIYQACSLFYDSERDIFLGVPFDCRNQIVNDWKRVTFGHKVAQGGQPVSLLGFDLRHHALGGFGSPDWMPQLIPASYKCEQFNSFTSVGGNLALLLGFAAFSGPYPQSQDGVGTALRAIGSFRPPFWSPHPYKTERVHGTGVIVSVKSLDNNEDVLSAYQRGDFGPLIINREQPPSRPTSRVVPSSLASSRLAR